MSRKKKLPVKVLLCVCLLGMGTGLAGCGVQEKAMQLYEQLERQWEEEYARAAAEEEGLGETSRLTLEQLEEQERKREAQEQENPAGQDQQENAGQQDSQSGTGQQSGQNGAGGQTGTGQQSGQNGTGGQTSTGQQSGQNGTGGQTGTGQQGSQTGEQDAEGQEAATASFVWKDADHYAYDSLNDAEKIWYRNMLRVLGNMEEQGVLSDKGLDAGLDETSIGKIFQCILNDHPELFYVEGYTYTTYTRLDKPVKIEFSGNYSMDREAAGIRKEEIEAAAQQVLSGISAQASDYEKVKYVYETIIRNTDYVLSAPDNQNIYSVFVNHASVCQGYAKAVQYLLNRLGIECTIAMGTVDTGEGHAWNLVKVDGAFYYVDATWGDASYQMEETQDSGTSRTPPEINYDYLCVTTEQLLRTHTLGGEVPMPVCDNLEANYYVREGTYFTRYDETKLTEVFQRYTRQGLGDVTLKCADAATYRTMEQRLIKEQGIFQYLDSPDGVIAYAQNEKQLSMTFWVTKQ